PNHTLVAVDRMRKLVTTSTSCTGGAGTRPWRAISSRTAAASRLDPLSLSKAARRSGLSRVSSTLRGTSPGDAPGSIGTTGPGDAAGEALGDGVRPEHPETSATSSTARVTIIIAWCMGPPVDRRATVRPGGLRINQRGNGIGVFGGRSLQARAVSAAQLGSLNA